MQGREGVEMGREIPILMSGPLVRATLAGLKTQTRRPIKRENKPDPGFEWAECLCREIDPSDTPCCTCEARFPGIASAGDRLWVRETWTQLLAVSPQSDEPLPIGPGERLIEPPTQWTDRHGRRRWNYDGKVIAYRANSDIEFCDGDGHSSEFANRADMPRWRSSTCMPRWACRLVLPLVSVRVERVQDISEADAWAEGYGEHWQRRVKEAGADGPLGRPDACGWFAMLWDKLYGTWGQNPWVAVHEWGEIEVSK